MIRDLSIYFYKDCYAKNIPPKTDVSCSWKGGKTHVSCSFSFIKVRKTKYKKYLSVPKSTSLQWYLSEVYLPEMTFWLGAYDEG